MDGHPTSSAKKDVTTTAPIREPTGNYNRNPIFDDDNAEPQSQKPSTHDNYAMGMDMDAMYGQYQLPKDDDNLYAEQQNHLHQEAPTNVHEQYVHPSGVSAGSGFLSGPMVVMVRPDGTPVNTHLPKDDDQEAMTIGKEGLPTVEQIAQHYGTNKNQIDDNSQVGASRISSTFIRPAVRYQPYQQRAFYYHNNNYYTQ